MTVELITSGMKFLPPFCAWWENDSEEICDSNAFARTKVVPR